MFKQRIFAALILLAVGAPAAMADGPTPVQAKAMDTLKTLVTNTVYTTTYAIDKSHFYFDIQAK